MSDLVYSEKLCGLKKYFINYTDKGRWNPSSPMINIDNEAMSSDDKILLGEFWKDYENDIAISAKKMLIMHQQKSEEWDIHFTRLHNTDPHSTNVQFWVIKEMIRLSCKYEERGDYGLEGYFRSCFNNPWELLNWRNFIDNVDSNVPTWIKDKGNLYEKIYKDNCTS